MTAPANRTVIITIPGVKRVTGNVTYVMQLGPRRGVANLTIETRDVLPAGTYDADYQTPSQESAGTFQMFKYGTGKYYRW